MPPSTAAVNASMPSVEAGVVPGVADLQHVHHRGDAGHQAAEQEDQRDDPVLVDAHQRGAVRVLRDRADAAAEPGAVDEPVQDEHHHQRQHDDQDLQVGDDRCCRCGTTVVGWISGGTPREVELVREHADRLRR